MSVRLSPDGMYYWDGERWQSTLSHDGRSRWNGAAWVPAGQPLAYAPSSTAPRTVRQPTSWTRPLQYAIGAYYAISALYVVSLPFTMGGLMSQVVNQSLRRQQSLNPAAPTPPPGFVDAMTSVMNGILWVAAVVGFAICVVALIAAWKRWNWAFYVILVLFGFGLVALPIDAIDLFASSALSSLNGVTMPSWIYLVGIASGTVSGALFIWMLVALVKRGPWATTKVAA